jgi:hypothetical protein
LYVQCITIVNTCSRTSNLALILLYKFYWYRNPFGSRDSSVGTATGKGLDGRGVGVWVPVGAGYFVLHVVQTGSGAHPASYRMGSSPTSTEIRNMWICIWATPYIFMVK